jgi:adenylate cyclase
MEIQRAVKERNFEVPEDRRIEFRIGINVGDIMGDAGDIYGDGVNIAARVESLAKPGSIYLAENAYQQIKGKVHVDLDDLGEQRLKNIAQPIRVYCVHLHGGKRQLAQTMPDKPSIAVLPFTNMSGDPEQEYFADGIAEDIITALARVRQFFVMTRNTTFTYKGRAVDIQNVAKDLGVRYVLEGSVRRAGNRVRITAQLIEGPTGKHLWAERYDREIADVFAVQDEITQIVVGAIGPELSRAEQSKNTQS